MTHKGPESFAATAEELFEDAPCGYLIFSSDRIVIRANRTVLGWVGAEAEQVVGQTFLELLSGGGRIYFETHVDPLLLVQGAVPEIALDLIRRDGTKLPVLANFVRVGDTDGIETYRVTLVDATERRAWERELVAARSRAEADADRLAVLYRVSSELSRAVEPRGVAAAVSGISADVLGTDTTVLWRLNETRGVLEATPLPGRSEDLPLLPLRRGAYPHWEAIDSQTILELTVETARRRYPAFADAMEALGHRTIRIVPWAQGTVSQGVIAYGFAESQPFDLLDEQLLETITDQAAAALERAQLYERERRAVITWQQSLMPHSLPQDDRARLEAFYLPSSAELMAGGDWYDAARLDANRVSLVVGDIVGHGVEAAAAMGQLRSAAGALAQAGLGPAQVLEQVDMFAEQLPQAMMATVLCAELDVASGVLRYSRAGHMPPLHLRSTGATAYLQDPGDQPIGLGVSRRRTEGTANLAAGDRILLFTDGLVERPDESIDVGLSRLASAASQRRWSRLAELVGLVALETRRDDVCVLSVELLSAGANRPE